MRIILVSGLSGSGKTVGLRALEDAGFVAIDNLPVAFLAPVVEHLARQAVAQVAIAIDARTGGLEALPGTLERLAEQGHRVDLLFLEARDGVLLERFSETRRTHPLAREGRPLVEATALEREVLGPLSQRAHRIDTSDLSAGMLRAWIREFVFAGQGGWLTLTFESFGYKHGVPLDADLVFDARCLPNPYYDKALRPLTGRDEPVVRWLEAIPEVEAMFAEIAGFLDRWLPCYEREHRAYLTVAVGCTGGQHRSVYLVERLGRAFAARGRVLVRHRDCPAVLSA